MVATALSEEVHSTEVVTSCVVPSVKAPVAANWSAVPREIVGDKGATETETRVAGFTVNTAEPLTPAAVAVMLVWPVVRLLAMPVEEMVATDAGEETQLTEQLKSSVLPSE